MCLPNVQDGKGRRTKKMNKNNYFLYLLALFPSPPPSFSSHSFSKFTAGYNERIDLLNQLLDTQRNAITAGRRALERQVFLSSSLSLHHQKLLFLYAV
jgi:hypothetical protein